MQKIVYSAAIWPLHFFQNTTQVTLSQENAALRSQLLNTTKLQQDNTALRDQFALLSHASQTLLPSYIIGMPGFFPGLASPEDFILDVGKKDGVATGDSVVSRANLLGIIIKTSDHAALVQLVTNKATSFTAKTVGSNVQGVLTGQGNGIMVLGNVLLSQTLTVGDTVVTSGSQNLSGQGFAPNLLVGKITSVAKNPSSLYQSASVVPLIPFANLSLVFVQIK